MADALTLGSHYEYDARVIKSAYDGTISEFMGPGEKMGGSTHGVGWGRRNYHPGKNKLITGLFWMLNFEYLLLFLLVDSVEKIKTNITDST